MFNWSPRSPGCGSPFSCSKGSKTQQARTMSANRPNLKNAVLAAAGFVAVSVMRAVTTILPVPPQERRIAVTRSLEIDERDQTPQPGKEKALQALFTAVVDAAAVSSGLWVSYILITLYLAISVSGVTHFSGPLATKPREIAILRRRAASCRLLYNRAGDICYNALLYSYLCRIVGK